MWNRKAAVFALIKIKHGPFRLVFPVPIFIFYELLEGILDLALLWARLFPSQNAPALVLSLAFQMLAELRNLGRWELIDLTLGQDRVNISFY